MCQNQVFKLTVVEDDSMAEEFDSIAKELDLAHAPFLRR
jgi:hypothetical protein